MSPAELARGTAGCGSAKGNSMSDDYNKDLCDERHDNLDKWVNKVETNVKENRKAINGQKNWIIGVLVAVVLNLMGVVVLLAK